MQNQTPSPKSTDAEQPADEGLDETPCSAFAGSLWTHLKSARLYIVVGECQIESTNEPGVLYRGLNEPNGKLWARSKAEFLDGRFEQFSQGKIS